jgi:hypothetical protein
MSLGLTAGLMVTVYYANIVLLSVLAVESVNDFGKSYKIKAEGLPAAKNLIIGQSTFAVVIVLSLIPTFATRYIIYGGPFETGYTPLKNWLWSSPQFANVLFSSNHGLLLWTPIIMFSFLGLILLGIESHESGAAFLAAATSYYFLVSFYPDWAGISSFGNRFFVSLTALFVIGLAVLFEKLAVLFSSTKLATLMFSVFSATFVLWNCGLIFQWGMHLIPVRGPVSIRQAVHNQIFVVPRQVSQAMKDYIFERQNLMNEIERRDIEQIKNSGYE